MLALKHAQTETHRFALEDKRVLTRRFALKDKHVLTRRHAGADAGTGADAIVSRFITTANNVLKAFGVFFINESTIRQRSKPLKAFP